MSTSSMVANSANETKVLCLYSGGTLGMLATSQGYVPEKGYLTVGLAVQGLPSQLRPKTDSARSSERSNIFGPRLVFTIL